MSLKKGHIEMTENFYLGTHWGCTRSLLYTTIIVQFYLKNQTIVSLTKENNWQEKNCVSKIAQDCSRKKTNIVMN